MPTIDRPPAGGLGPEDSDGRILEIRGKRYRAGPEGLELLKVLDPLAISAEVEAEIAAEIGDRARNPAGNPYQAAP